MSVYEHKKNAPETVRCHIITVSDTRTKDTDKSGKTIVGLLENADYEVSRYDIVTDEDYEIRQMIRSSCEQTDIDMILLNGGTGIAKRDVTYEVVEDLLEKQLSGFGELFRMLSYTEDIGSAAMLSRAIAGTIGETAIFSMPGSTGAVRLAMEKLILPEAGHVVSLLKQ